MSLHFIMTQILFTPDVLVAPLLWYKGVSECFNLHTAFVEYQKPVLVTFDFR